MTLPTRGPVLVRAAGVLPFRHTPQGLEVALVHRPRYADWSWAKGKLDRGEDFATAAARECLEETGLQVRLGVPLPTSAYLLTSRGSAVRPIVKQVRYWAGTPIGGHGRLEHEIDEVAWLTVEEAAARLSYDRDREQLRALVAADTLGLLRAWPLVILRHAKAEPRGAWRHQDDQQRPLTAVGRRRAERLREVLAAYTPTRLVTSPSVRCRDTLAPYAAAAGLRLPTKQGLSEEGYAARPERASRHLGRLLERAEPAAICTHGPVLPELLESLARRGADKVVSRGLRRLVAANLDKGEALACLVDGSGEAAQVIHIERHRPPRG